MISKYQIIYEGKAKKIIAHEDSDKVIIKFKDDATAFNALKKATFKGKGKLNCLISAKIFEYLINKNIPTHFIELIDSSSIIAQKIDIIPLEIVLRNIAYGSICKQTNIKPGTIFDQPLIDYYYKNDSLNDPLLTEDRIYKMEIIRKDDLDYIKESRVTFIILIIWIDVSCVLIVT